MKPYRAIDCDAGSWSECQDPDCDWSGEHGAEDHCERTGHRVREERWRYYEKHCEVEAFPIGEEEQRLPPGIEGTALFFESTDYADWVEVLESPTWEDLRQAASRMMIATEDTHHCFLEGVHEVKGGPLYFAAHVAARAAGIDTAGVDLYRLSMGS